MAGVSLQGVSKRYGRIVAVEELDLDIADGEMMMLVNGRGSQQVHTKAASHPVGKQPPGTANNRQEAPG